MTQFAQIVTALEAALSAAPAVAPNIYRVRLRPIAQQHSSAVVIRLQESRPDRGPFTGAPVDWTTSIAIECYARTDSTTPDLAVDTLVQDVYARLALDATLGGTVADLFATGMEWDFDAEANKFACVTLGYAIQHRTAENTLE